MIKICLQKLDFYKTLYLKPNKTIVSHILSQSEIKDKILQFSQADIFNLIDGQIKPIFTSFYLFPFI